MKQHVELVEEGDGLLTGGMRAFIVLEPLLEIGLAFGTREQPHRLVFFVNGAVGLTLQLMQSFKEVAKLMEIIRDPQGQVAGSLVASHDALATIRGHAKTDAVMIVKRFEMRFPGLSRAI